MNILFICDEYPPGKNGGIGTITRSLARGMVEAGHGVFVAGLYPLGYGQADYEEDQGVRIWRKRFAWDIGLIGNSYSLKDTVLLRLLSGTGLLRRDARQSARRFHSFILDLIEKFQIDIVEWPDYNEYFSYLPSGFALPPLPVPLVVKFHGTRSYIHHQLQEKFDPDGYLLEKRHMERANALVSVSRHTADNYRSFYGLQQEIAVLYNSIGIPEEQGPDGSDSVQTIIYAGALSRGKGVWSLMEAWNIVHTKYPGARLRIFGKGRTAALRARLSDAARNSVRFEGFVSKERLDQALSTAEAAIFPSYTECFSLAPLEAMAVGCPVIYTRRASGPELIQTGVNGLLADPDNYQEMADSMILLLSNKAMRELLSQNGRRTIEQRFGNRASVRDHIQLYQRLLNTAIGAKYL